MPSKLEKFAQVSTFSNCFVLHHADLDKGFELKGKWRGNYFNNHHPIVIELGCGKGEYTIGLAEKHPEKNFIGVDIKGNRIWTGATQALKTGMKNVAFLRTRIDFATYCFGTDEVDEIWITFPDPQPQKPRAKKRLTHPLFLERYRSFLKAGGLLHLKTDNQELYEFTLGVIRDCGHELLFATGNLHAECPPGREELVSITTWYEKLFSAKGISIKYICFRLRNRNEMR